MSSVLDIKISKDGGITIIALNGSVDASTQDTLQSKVFETINKDANKIIIDLSGVTYLGSAGLRGFHAISNKLKEDAISGKMNLLNPSEAAAKIMKTLGFDSFFDIYNDLDKAKKAF